MACFYAAPLAWNPTGVDNKVWTVRLSRDLIISLIFITLSGVMANYVRDPTLQLAFAVTSITLITEGLSSMAFATATRTGMVNRLALLDLIPILITILVSIGLALVFKNYWALVISGTFGSILKMWLSYSMFPHSGRRLRFDKSIFLDIWNFGRFIVPSSIIALLIGQGDKFILVRFLTLHQLGLYSLASALSSAPSALMNSYSNRILYPAFSDPQLSTSARS